jgi:hypothetical protein
MTSRPRLRTHRSIRHAARSCLEPCVVQAVVPDQPVVIADLNRRWRVIAGNSRDGYNSTCWPAARHELAAARAETACSPGAESVTPGRGPVLSAGE